MRLIYQALLVTALCGAVFARPPRGETESEEYEAPTRTRGFYPKKKATCGYDSCPVTKDGVLNVHLIPHTHDDVGWLKTVDQYYYGSLTMTQKAGVQYILDSVVDALVKDETRKFIYVETAFFWKWWNEQNDQKRHQVTRLVNEGRLEFVGGAWSMNDEATVHYQSVVDQFTWGLRKLNDTFGECGRPRAGWQIDPFGHSKEQANLFAAMGYDGLLLGRIDYQDKSRRRLDKEMEMIWQASDDLGKAGDLFTGVMFNTYSPPPGFCFDILCADDPVIDDPSSPDYNVDAMVGMLLDYLRLEAESYRTNHTTVTMGGDFTYMHAEVWYKNMDKLIKYVNAKEPSVNLFYSTPSCYLKSLHDTNITWPTKSDDFFPYASDGNSYWTGYFTSRPTLKYFERKSNSFLQVCKQLYAMTNLNEQDKVDLNMLRSVMGVMQHHDAVTGTEKQHVARDYARMLDLAVQDCLVTTREALNKLMSEKPPGSKKHQPKAPYMPMTLCELNITQCSITEKSENFVVTVYNPLGHVIDHYVRLPVSGERFTVRDPQGAEQPTQLMTLSKSLLEQLDGRNSTATAELIFLAANLPPVGYRSYYITASSSDAKKLKKDVESEEMMMDAPSKEPVVFEKEELLKERAEDSDDLVRRFNEVLDEENTIGNEHLSISVDPDTGFINKLFIARYNLTVPLKQELLYYEGQVGNNEIAANRSSGAYILRPKPIPAQPTTTKPENVIYKGPLVEEIHQRFSNWSSQIIRVYKNQKHVEFEWLVGPIPILDMAGKEVISRFSTDLKSNGTFYTDSNGRQLLKRKIDYRPTWNLTLEEPVGGNYYPVTSMIAINDPEQEVDLTVLTDRAQGGASLKDGEIELMVHRRLLRDDAFGVGEALNETETAEGKGLVARGTHYLFVGKRHDKGPVYRRQLVLLKQLEPTILITSADNITFPQWQDARNEFSGLVSELPSNVHILTLEPWKDRTVLVRFEHYLQKTDDPEELSKPVTIRLNRVFSDIEIISIKETTLGANQYLNDSNRFQWIADKKKDYNRNYYKTNQVNGDLELNKEDTYKLAIEELKIQVHEQEEQLIKLQKTIHKIQKPKTKVNLHLNKEKKDKLNEYLNDYYPHEQIPSDRRNNEKKLRSQDRDDYIEIELQPMEIRTFIIEAKFLD